MVTRLPELQKRQLVDKHVLLSIYFDMSWIEKIRYRTTNDKYMVVQKLPKL